MPWIYLVLALVVLVVGLGVVLLNRRRSRPAPTAPSTPIAVVDSAKADDVADAVDVVAPHVPIQLERPNFRSRMSKARGALAGTLLGIRSRSGITQETWDDIEEALLRADVGVRVTDDLLGGLRVRVKAKEITDPGELLDALQAEMVDSPVGCRPVAAFRRHSGRAQCLAVRRCQRCRQDDHHRQGRRTAGSIGPLRVDGSG